MRKLILQMQISLDGFVAGPNNEGDWIMLPGKQDPAALQSTTETLKSCDTLLLGRASVDGFVSHWENTAKLADNPWQPFAQHITDMRKIVFSRTETDISGPNLEVSNGDLATTVNELKNQPGKDIIAYGGVDFASSLVELNLVDEYILILNPVALGSGKSIFKEKRVLKLEKAVVFTNGKILNKYLPV